MSSFEDPKGGGKGMLRVAGVAAAAATALVCIAAASGGGPGLLGDVDDAGFRGRTELGQQAVTQWLHTLKGAESFLDDSEKGRLPAKSIVPQSLSSVEKLLKETKEQVHREATRLSKMQKPKGDALNPPMPYGADKLAVGMAPGEKNREEGFQGLARRDVRPGQVMREVTDLVDEYKAEEDEAAKSLLRSIAGKIVEAFDSHGLSAAQIARAVTDEADAAGGSSKEGPSAAGSEGNKADRGRSGGKEGGKKEGKKMRISGVTGSTLMGYDDGDVGVADCTDLPGLPKSSKFCLEGRPRSKLPGLDAAMTTGDIRGKIKELKRRAYQNMGLPNANKIDQEELSKLKDIVLSTSKALKEQEGKLAEIKAGKKAAMSDLNAQKRVLNMAKDARMQRLAWRRMDGGMTRAYKEAGYTLPSSAGR